MKPISSEAAPAPTPPADDMQPITEGQQKGDQPAQEEGRRGNVQDFIKHMKRPVEKVDAPPFVGAQQEEEKMPDDSEGEPITDDDEGNLQYLDYSEEHKMTALFFIGLIDNGMGWIGTMISGQTPEKYRKFSDQAKPPDYYVNVTAALVKKYQAKMSLEMMFFSALLMIYAPAMKTAWDDRKIEKEKQSNGQK